MFCSSLTGACERETLFVLASGILLVGASRDRQRSGFGEFFR
jgi:hypothetical protein